MLGCSSPDVTLDGVAYDPPEPSLRRLTQPQYRNAIHDLFGADVLVAGNLEPDTRIADFESVGASATSISPRGVEQYEAQAFDVAQQVLRDPARRAALVPCTPAGPEDDACARAALGPLGRRLFRRPLTVEELGAFTGLATAAGRTLGDFHQGLEFAVAGLLQSPDFLFRDELGQPDPARPAGARLDGYALASRLAFFLWNGPPDDELLDAAAGGALATDDGVRAQVTRLLASARARRGLRAFAAEWLDLAVLDDLVKDPMVFTQISADLGPAAREQTLLDIEGLVFDDDADFRDLMTTRTTHLNRKLASVYGVRAPVQEGFGVASLPDDQARRGLLGQASVLASHAHPVSSSPTLRGKFVREILLCHEIPPPPANFNTAIPPPSETARTLRERLALHDTDPFCGACHGRTDPIGLGLEQFDGLGLLRDTDRGAVIDASGDLDGRRFADAAELAEVIRNHPDHAACVSRRLFRYAVGHEEAAGEEALIARLGEVQAARGYRLKALLAAIATSEAFRRTGLTQIN